MQWQKASIQKVTGLQNVYLVANGTYGAGNLDKFKFGSDASPVRPPSQYISKSGEGTVIIRNLSITSSPPGLPCISISGAVTQVIIDNVEVSGCGGHGIRITNSNNVTITGSDIHDILVPSNAQNRDADGIYASGVTNLKVENNRFKNIYTSNLNKDDRQYEDKFAVGVRTSNSSGVTVQRNDFRNVGSGLYATPGSTTVKFLSNTSVDAKGPFPRGQMVQFDGVTGSGNSIMCNRSDTSDYTNNKTEDHINVYKSTGVSMSDPLLVAYNRLRGGSSSGSGSGIVGGDREGKYIKITGNRVVNVNGVGVGVAGGQYIEASGNKIFMNHPNGVVGMKAANYSIDNGQLVGVCQNLYYSNNLINVQSTGYWTDPFDIKTENGYDQYGNLEWGKCDVFDPTRTGSPRVSETAPQSNNVNATSLTAAIYDEPIPECN